MHIHLVQIRFFFKVICDHEQQQVFVPCCPDCPECSTHTCDRHLTWRKRTSVSEQIWSSWAPVLFERSPLEVFHAAIVSVLSLFDRTMTVQRRTSPARCHTSFKPPGFQRFLRASFPHLQVDICCQTEASRPAHHSSPWPPLNASSSSPPAWRPGLRTSPRRPPAPGNPCVPVEGNWQCPPCSLLRLMQVIVKRWVIETNTGRRRSSRLTDWEKERRSRESQRCHVTNWTPDWSQRAEGNKKVSLSLSFPKSQIIINKVVVFWTGEFRPALI